MVTQVYRRKPSHVHVKDGQRRTLGAMAAEYIGAMMRRADGFAADMEASEDLPLCPGCYMTVLVNAATYLAQQNGQSLAELGVTLGRTFLAIARGDGDPHPEGVDVIRPRYAEPSPIVSDRIEYASSENLRNRQCADLFRRLIRRAYGDTFSVAVGHHVMFSRDDEMDEIPSADCLMFSHDLMSRVFGERAVGIMQDLAGVPQEQRAALLETHLATL